LYAGVGSLPPERVRPRGGGFSPALTLAAGL